MKRITRILGAIGVVAVVTLLSRLGGFMRVLVQYFSLGDTAIGEAFSTANAIPNVFFEIVIGGALAGSVVPIVGRYIEKNDDQEKRNVASALMVWTFLVASVMAGVVYFLSAPLISLLMPESRESSVVVASTLLRIFSFQIPLYAIAVVSSGILQAHKKFFLSSFVPLLSSLVTMGAFFLFYMLAFGMHNSPEHLSYRSLMVLAWGVNGGVAMLALPQFIAVMRYVSLTWTIRFPHGVLRQVLALSLAGLGGLIAQQVATVCIMFFANRFADGGAYPIYTFANAIYMLPFAVLSYPVATVIFPVFSRLIVTGEEKEISLLAMVSSRLVLYLGVIGAGILLVSARPLSVFFHLLRPVDGLYVAIVSMAPALIGFVLMYHFSRLLYSLQASRVVMFSQVGAWSCVALFLIIAGYAKGIMEREALFFFIGSALTVGMSIGAFVQYIFLRRLINQDHRTFHWLKMIVIILLIICIAGISWAMAEIVMAISTHFAIIVCALIFPTFVFVGMSAFVMWKMDKDACVILRSS